MIILNCHLQASRWRTPAPARRRPSCRTSGTPWGCAAPSWAAARGAAAPAPSCSPTTGWSCDRSFTPELRIREIFNLGNIHLTYINSLTLFTCIKSTLNPKRSGEEGSVRHMSANACLTPLVSLHGMAVTTVEGIGSTK